jgi:hypothetical protein
MDQMREILRLKQLIRRYLRFLQSRCSSFVSSQRGAYTRTIQELLGHNDVSTAIIYMRVVRQGGSGMKSPLDCL